MDEILKDSVLARLHSIVMGRRADSTSLYLNMWDTPAGLGGKMYEIVFRIHPRYHFVTCVAGDSIFFLASPGLDLDEGVLNRFADHKAITAMDSGRFDSLFRFILRIVAAPDDSISVLNSTRGIPGLTEGQLLELEAIHIIPPRFLTSRDQVELTAFTWSRYGGILWLEQLICTRSRLHIQSSVIRERLGDWWPLM
jgi:hypothetical protein